VEKLWGTVREAFTEDFAADCEPQLLLNRGNGEFNLLSDSMNKVCSSGSAMNGSSIHANRFSLCWAKNGVAEAYWQTSNTSSQIKTYALDLPCSCP
jgi:hypothetical protein